MLRSHELEAQVVMLVRLVCVRQLVHVYRLLRWIGCFRFELNLWVFVGLKVISGPLSGGRRWAVLDILDGHWEGLWASRLSSSKHVFVEKLQGKDKHCSTTSHNRISNPPVRCLIRLLCDCLSTCLPHLLKDHTSSFLPDTTHIRRTRALLHAGSLPILSLSDSPLPTCPVLRMQCALH